MALLRGNRRWHRLAEAGVNTRAVLVAFQEVGQQNFRPLVDLRLRITPEDGSAPFEVVTRTQIDFSQIGNLKPGDEFSMRYDPEDHTNHELGMKIISLDADAGEATAAGKSLDSSSASEIAARFQATGGAGPRRSAAELLATGQRMTAVLREFSPLGKTVGELDPAQPDPNDPVYVFKAELPINGSSPIESVFINRVPEAKVQSLRLGGHLNVAVNPANPSREVTIDWTTSPLVS